MRIIYSVFLLSIFLSSCEDAPTVEAPTPTPGVTVDSPWQFSVTIDGTTIAERDSIHSYSGGFSTSGFIAPFPDTSALIFESSLSNDTSNTNSLYIQKGTLRFASGAIPPDSTFEDFFLPTSYSYSFLAVNGILIKWYDSNGELWRTDAGTGDQTGSAFVISGKKASFVNGYLDIKIKATFNCKLYNSTGQAKTLTGGLYVGSFEPI